MKGSEALQAYQALEKQEYRFQEDGTDGEVIMLPMFRVAIEAGTDMVKEREYTIHVTPVVNEDITTAMQITLILDTANDVGLDVEVAGPGFRLT